MNQNRVSASGLKKEYHLTFHLTWVFHYLTIECYLFHRWSPDLRDKTEFNWRQASFYKYYDIYSRLIILSLWYIINVVNTGKQMSMSQILLLARKVKKICATKTWTDFYIKKYYYTVQ